MQSNSGNKKIGIDFTNGSLFNAFVAFLIPFLLANILNSLYNAVDMVIIGKYVGVTGTAAVSTGGKLLNMYTLICSGLAGGGQIYISQLIGKGNKEKINNAIGTLFSLLIVISTIVAVLTIVFSRQILNWMNVDTEYYQGAWNYLLITSIGLPFLYCFNAVSSVLRGMGDSKHPLLFISIAAVSNLVLDIVFIAVFQMGEAGAAIATVIGQTISLVLAVGLLYKEKECFGFDFKKESFKINNEDAKIMLKIGLPNAIRNGLISSVQVVMTGCVNAYGTIDAAAFGIGTKISSLATVVSTSCTQAGGAVVAQNLGANKPERAKKQVFIELAITLGFAIVLSIPALAFPEIIFGLFTDNPQVMIYANPMMRIVVLTLFLAAMVSSFGATTTGSGASGLSLLSGIMDGIVFRVGLSFFFAYVLNHGMMGFALGDSLARVAYILINGAYFFSGKWEKRRLVK